MKHLDERTIECNTNTKYKLMFSGYYWAREQIKNLDESTILDAACGTGYGSYYLSEKAKIVYGIDISPEVVVDCKKKYKRDNLMFLEMNCENLQFTDNTFDFIISQDTIEHVQDDRKFLSEIKRVLKKDGTCIIFTPNSQEHNPKPENYHHLREYSKDSFRELLSNYFHGITFYGKRPSQDLIQLENDLDKIRRYDLCFIRRIIPVNIRHTIASLILKLKGRKSLKEVSCQDIDFFPGTEGAVTQIAICKK